MSACPTTVGGTTAVFNLNSMNATITGGVAGSTVTFFTSQANANSNTGAITDAGAYTSGNATLFARVVGANGCVAVSQVTLTINPAPQANNATMSACPTTVGGTTAVFNLNSMNATITGGVAGSTVTFFSTQANANSNTGAITNAGSFTSGNATLFARVVGANGCVAVSQVTLTVTQPVCNITGPSLLCVGQTGTFTAPAGATNITWTITSSNCEFVGSNNNMTLVVRATGSGVATIRLNATLNGCPIQCEIQVNVNPGPTANRVDYSLCPTVQGGSTAVFNLMLPELQNQITGGVAGVSITGFFTTFDAAAANVAGTQISNASAYTSNTSTIYARVVTTAGCVTIARLDLTVRNIVLSPGARSADDCSARITVVGTISGGRAAQTGDAGNLNVTASPNPFSDRVRFSIQSDFSGQGTLEVFNTIGAKIKTVFQGPVVAGQSQTVEFAVPSAQRVNLIYVMTVGNRQVTGKLINLR
jgi:hypothetical protein